MHDELKSYKVGTVDNFSYLHSFGGLHKSLPDPHGNRGQDIYQYCTVNKRDSICGLGHRLNLTCNLCVYLLLISPDLSSSDSQNFFGKFFKISYKSNDADPKTFLA